MFGLTSPTLPFEFINSVISSTDLGAINSAILGKSKSDESNSSGSLAKNWYIVFNPLGCYYL